jgi:hypothetical protein
MITEFLNPMGFSVTESPGIYWHLYFGPTMLFDMNDCTPDKWSIMQRIFDIVSKYGEDKKIKEIRSMLELPV